ncbi:FkbM family methyltransferase [bacterium]|nr:FkbM family methyltransferase [bacterium]
MLNRLREFLKKDSRSTTPQTGVMAKRGRFADMKMFTPGKRPVIVDVGANKGRTIRRFLQLFPDATIFAFEPQPDLADDLRAAFADTKRVEVRQMAVGSRVGEIEFQVLRHASSSSALPPSQHNIRYHPGDMDVVEKIRVQQTTLDSALDVERVDILKLDIQGFELEALRGATQILKKTNLLMTEIEFLPLYEEQGLFADVDTFLRGQGFRLFNLYDLFTQEDGQLTAGDALYLNESQPFLPTPLEGN